MPPREVCRGWQEANHEHALSLLVPSLARPCIDFPAIGRVHKDSVTGPALLKAIVGLGKELRAFVIFGGRARIKSEFELFVEWYVDLGRRDPVPTVAIVATVVLRSDAAEQSRIVARGDCPPHWWSAVECARARRSRSSACNKSRASCMCPMMI